MTTSDAGVVTIAGGKLTTYREMAEDTVGRDPSITHLHAPPLLVAEVN